MMNNSFTYPDVIWRIQETCRLHIAGDASADELQHAIWDGESVMVDVEENDLHDFLTDVEGQLELIKFTVNSAEQLFATQGVAQAVLTWLGSYQKRSR